MLSGLPTVFSMGFTVTIVPRSVIAAQHGGVRECIGSNVHLYCCLTVMVHDRIPFHCFDRLKEQVVLTTLRYCVNLLKPALLACLPSHSIN